MTELLIPQLSMPYKVSTLIYENGSYQHTTHLLICSDASR